MADINYERIGARLREARKIKGMTQKYVAEYLDIETNSYSNLERGAQPINLKRIIELCILYGIKPGYLLDDCCPELLHIDNRTPENATDDHKALCRILETCSDKVKHTLLMIALTLQSDDDQPHGN